MNAAADLVAEYPGKITLKRPLDPSQNGPRPNNKHLEMNLRNRASIASKDRVLNHSRPKRCRRGADMIELVPYDKYLQIYLNYTETYCPT